MGGPIGRMAAAALVAMAVATGAMAQVPELTERYRGDGWSVAYPAGWLVLVDDPLLLGNAEGMLATVQRGDDPPEGGIAVGVFPAAVLEALGVPPANSVEGLLAAIAGQFNGPQGDAQPLADWALPALAITLSVPADGETWAIAAKTPTGDLLGLVVSTADMAVVLPLVEAMVASFALE
ncbi:MAG: hypothetical protein KIT43_00495 [Bauldia sp.]|nr:hypothetical protein [Bauldia sp.]MCW5718075.1 hypothetical protein [Bauldia sp.]